MTTLPVDTLHHLSETDDASVRAFLRTIPYRAVWVSDPATEDPIAADVLDTLCQDGRRVSATDLAALNATIRAAERPVEHVLSIAHDTHTHAVCVRSLPITVDGQRRILMACRDISLEARLEDALKDARRRVQQLEYGQTIDADEAVQLALADTLTGLPNRRAFDAEMRAACTTGNAALCLMDVDRFKMVNDSLGHTVGDQLLKAIASNLQIHTRGKDFVSRLAGDEFAIVFHDISTKAGALEAVERILSTFRTRIDLGEVDLQVSLSAGVTAIARGSDPDTVFRAADVSLHTAKLERRAPLTAHAIEGATLEEHDALRRVKAVLSGGPLPLSVEPLVDAAGAPVAWRARFGDTVDIERLFATAHKFGLTTELTTKIAARALRAHTAGGRLQIPLPAMALFAPGAANTLLQVAASEGRSSSDVAVEVSTASAQTPEMVATTTALRLAGVGVVLTGWTLGLGDYDCLASGRFDAALIDAAALGDGMLDGPAADAVTAGVRLAGTCGLTIHAINAADAKSLHACGITGVIGPIATARTVAA
ncbi:MAG: diguanylate cyclase [Pseudomonadota bacterium]